MLPLKISSSILHRDCKSIKMYLNEIAKIELLDPEDEIRILKRVKKGDEKAFEILVKSNLRFVVSVASKYQKRGLSLGDLVNEGNLGLIEAAKRFDETKGFKFISYAVWWIRQRILRALRDKVRPVVMPANLMSLSIKVNRFCSKFEQKKGRMPTVLEISGALHETCNQIKVVQKIGYFNFSLDASFDSEENQTLCNILADKNVKAPDSSFDYESLCNQVGEVLDTLGDLEKKVVKMYFGIGFDFSYSVFCIARELNISTTYVHRLVYLSIKNLKESFSIEKLRPFLGMTISK